MDWCRWIGAKVLQAQEKQDGKLFAQVLSSSTVLFMLLLVPESAQVEGHLGSKALALDAERPLPLAGVYLPRAGRSQWG